MNLLWVTAKRLGSDRASTTQLAVANSLAKRGWDVTFVAPKNDGDVSELVKNSGHLFVGVDRSRKPGLGWFTFGRSLRKSLPKIISVDTYDVALIEWQAVAGSHATINRAGIPWLIVDRSPPVFHSLIGKLQWLEYRRAYKIAKNRGAAGSLPKSEALAHWNATNGRAVEPVTIMEAGVEVKRFTTANFSSTPTIIHHGQLDEEREIERLVSIGEILSAKEFEFIMKVAGRGNRLTALQKAATFHDWLEVVGPVPSDEIPAFLATGHVALFPLPDSEVWRLSSPLKVREWAAAGLPMVLSDITPHRAVGQRDWATLVRHDAPFDEWADAIMNLFESDLSILGATARKDAENEFDWDKTSEALHYKLIELMKK